MDKEVDFCKWFYEFKEKRNFYRVFASDTDYASLICGIAQIEAFENRLINSVFSAFAHNKDALKNVGLDDPLIFSLWINEDYSKAIIFFYNDKDEVEKIKVYPDLKSSSFKCYCQEYGNEQESIDFIEQCIDRTDT